MVDINELACIDEMSIIYKDVFNYMSGHITNTIIYRTQHEGQFGLFTRIAIWYIHCPDLFHFHIIPRFSVSALLFIFLSEKNSKVNSIIPFFKIVIFLSARLNRIKYIYFFLTFFYDIY